MVSYRCLVVSRTHHPIRFDSFGHWSGWGGCAQENAAEGPSHRKRSGGSSTQCHCQSLLRFGQSWSRLAISGKSSPFKWMRECNLNLIHSFLNLLKRGRTLDGSYVHQCAPTFDDACRSTRPTETAWRTCIRLSESPMRSTRPPFLTSGGKARSLPILSC